ncbi:MAG: hypothetical protein OXB86_02525 [Bdellovibrionales bacterium]|nr:hypothetical protein [Bdellovibrionales bacterium]
MSMPDALETGRFLYNTGYYRTLLKFSLSNLRKKKKVPWPFVMKTLTDHNITLSKEATSILLESLLPKYKEKHPWLSACGEWAEISREFDDFIQAQRKTPKNHLKTTQPAIQEDRSMGSELHSAQIEDSALSTAKKTEKTNLHQQSEQTDNSVLYKAEETQPDITQISEQLKPEKSVAPHIQATEEKNETKKPAVVLLDSPFAGVKAQEGADLEPNTSSKQKNIHALINKKSTQPDLSSNLKQINQSIPIKIQQEKKKKKFEKTEYSILYNKEETQPNITPELNELQLLRQLEFVQAKELMEEEEKIIALLLKKNPKKYNQLNTELQIKKALHFLQQQKSTRKGQKESYWPLSQKISEKKTPYTTQLCKETIRLTEEYPEKAKHLAIFLYTMGWPEEAIKILEKNIHAPSDYWFYLNWLMEIKKYAVALDMTNQLLTKFKSNPETLFPITYIKAQALYALGEKDKAISYMSDIVKVRPEYKSARHFIDEWTEV